MVIPPGFYSTDKTHGKLYRVLKSIYDVKHASRHWFSKFSKALLSFSFVASLNDYSMFFYSSNGEFSILLVYVDDVVITGTSQFFITKVNEFIHAKFSIKDWRPLHYFLGIEVARSSSCLFINQRKYALDLIYEAGLTGCKALSIPIDSKHKLALSKAPTLADPTPYRRLIGQQI